MKDLSGWRRIVQQASICFVLYALAWVVHCNAACSVLGTVRSGGSVLCCCLWEQQLRGREMHRE